jgi:transposase-like protein
MPAHAPEERDNLRALIQQNGVTDAILVDEDGEIIDGHTRKEISDELGVPCPTVVVEGLSEDEKVGLAVGRNLGRRNLSPAQKRSLVLGLRSRGSSQRQVSERTGMSQSAVDRYSKDAPQSSSDPNGSPAKEQVKAEKETKENTDKSPGQDQVRGRDGKLYPKRRPLTRVGNQPPRTGTPMTKEEQKDQARRMLADGHPVSFVAKTCGLSEPTVRKLRERERADAANTEEDTNKPRPDEAPSPVDDEAEPDPEEASASDRPQEAPSDVTSARGPTSDGDGKTGKDPETRMGRMTKLITETWHSADALMAEPAGHKKATTSERSQFTEVFMPFMKAMGTYRDQLLKDDEP